MKKLISTVIVLASIHTYALQASSRKVDVILGSDVSCVKTSTLRLSDNYSVVTDTPEGAEYQLQTEGSNLKARAGLLYDHNTLKAAHCNEEGLKAIGDHLRMHFHHILSEATVTVTKRNNFGIIVTTERIDVPVEGVVFSSQITTRQME